MEQDFYVRIIDGPSHQELAAAADALYRAYHPKHPTCEEINAAAIERGERPPYKWDDDIQLRSINLAAAELCFTYQGEFMKRKLDLQPTKIARRGNSDKYDIKCTTWFMIRRNLISNNGDIVRLYPRMDYDFDIVYDAYEHRGRIVSIGRSAEEDTTTEESSD